MNDVVTGQFGDERTPRQALIDCLNDCDDYKQVFIVAMGKDDRVHRSWSRGGYITHIGMLKFASDMLSDEMIKNGESEA